MLKNICYNHYFIIIIIRLITIPNTYIILCATVIYNAAHSFSTWYQKGLWEKGSEKFLFFNVKKGSAQLNVTI